MIELGFALVVAFMASFVTAFAVCSAACDDLSGEIKDMNVHKLAAFQAINNMEDEINALRARIIDLENELKGRKDDGK